MQDADSGIDAAATQYVLDGVAVSACTSPKIYTNLAVGNHSFVIKAFDKAANTTSTKAAGFHVQPGAGDFSIAGVLALSATSLQVAFGTSANATS